MRFLRPDSWNGTGRLVLPGITFITVLFLYPLARLMLVSVLGEDGLTLEQYERIFAEPAYARVLVRTIAVSGAVTFTCFLLGYPLGYALAGARGPLKTLLLLTILMPFWTNLLVRAYGWIVVLHSNGLVNRVLLALGVVEEPVALVYNTTGVIVGMTQILLPYMVLPIAAVTSRVDQTLVRAARSLGASPARAFVRITLPMTLPGVVAGSLLVFVLCLGFFVIPALLGGRRDVLVAQLVHFNLTTTLNWEFAAALSGVLLVTTLAIYFIVYRWLRLELLWGSGA